MIFILYGVRSTTRVPIVALFMLIGAKYEENL